PGREVTGGNRNRPDERRHGQIENRVRRTGIEQDAIVQPRELPGQHRPDDQPEPDQPCTLMDNQSFHGRGTGAEHEAHADLGSSPVARGESKPRPTAEGSAIPCASHRPLPPLPRSGSCPRAGFFYPANRPTRKAAVPRFHLIWPPLADPPCHVW